jgi:diaminopimelate epimerase
MKIPFTKAHGAKNDFLLTWRSDAPPSDLAGIARAMCDRHTGVGADGWMLVEPDPEVDGSIQLYNSDGSMAGISGNGTRCAAAFLIQHGCVQDSRASAPLELRTGAGVKTLRLVEHAGLRFVFEMNMGRPEIAAVSFHLSLSTGLRDVTLLWVGNPQCAVPVDDFDFDWRAMGAEIESHPLFPERTNVSFFKTMDEHIIEARFYERGAGETMSSGTGSMGVAAAAVARWLVTSPVRVLTPAGPLDLRIEEDVYLTGPAEIVAQGECFV